MRALQYTERKVTEARGRGARVGGGRRVEGELGAGWGAGRERVLAAGGGGERRGGGEIREGGEGVLVQHGAELAGTSIPAREYQAGTSIPAR
eukprot:337947-Rhodomonas_salina.1